MNEERNGTYNAIFAAVLTFKGLDVRTGLCVWMFSALPFFHIFFYNFFLLPCEVYNSFTNYYVGLLQFFVS